jgi:hypothetical protein
MSFGRTAEVGGCIGREQEERENNQNEDKIREEDRQT